MTSRLMYRIASTLPLPSRGDPTVVSINPEGTFIAVGSADGHVLIWCSRSHELFCQVSPPVNDDRSMGSDVTNMTWVTNRVLAFSRKNGLMSVLLVGKVGKPTRWMGSVDGFVFSALSKLYLLRPMTAYRCWQCLIAIHLTPGPLQLTTKSISFGGNSVTVAFRPSSVHPFVSESVIVRAHFPCKPGGSHRCQKGICIIRRGTAGGSYVSELDKKVQRCRPPSGVFSLSPRRVSILPGPPFLIQRHFPSHKNY